MSDTGSNITRGNVGNTNEMHHQPSVAVTHPTSCTQPTKLVSVHLGRRRDIQRASSKPEGIEFATVYKIEPGHFGKASAPHGGEDWP